MPLSNFYSYTIKEKSDKHLIVDVTIDPTHEVYKGHFPQQPITPGVILVEMARKILSEHTKTKLTLTSAKELKFLAPIIPSENTTITIDISFEKVENTYKVACLYTSEEKTFTKLKGLFSAK